MRKILLTCVFLIMAIPSVNAQERTVTGTVVDNSDVPLPGVTIQIKGQNTGTTTDFDGNYSINAQDSDILVFSYVGFVTQEVQVGAQNNIDIKLVEDTQELDEVVVTAVGVERSTKTITYARQGISSEELKEARSPNFLQTLSGKAAGIQVTGSASPTGSNRVTIRGNSSLLGNNNPLYIIDGIPMDQTVGDAQAGSWGGADSYQPVDYGDPMASINPDDIESIEVLKGGGATAVYGSRASNGVILITTKKGTKKDGWGVNINSNVMFQDVIQWPNYQYAYGSGNSGTAALDVNRLDPDTGLPLTNQSYAYGSPLLGQFNAVYLNGEIDPYVPIFGNIQDAFQTGTIITTSFSANKASEKGSFRFSYTNTSGEWIMSNQDLISRHNLSIRATQKLTEGLSLDVATFYTREDVDNRIVENGSTQNPAQNFIGLHPNVGIREHLTPWKDANGREIGSAGGDGLSRNPLWVINENKNADQLDRITGKIELNAEITDDISLSASVNADIRNITGFKYDAPRGAGVLGDQDGRYRTFDRRIQNINYDARLSYNKKFDDFQIDAYLGGRVFDYKFSERSMVNEQLLEIPDFISIANNAGITNGFEADSESVLQQGFLATNIGYKETFFLDGSYTREWSSVLAPQNQGFGYYSVGGSAIFTKFIPKNDILSFGKIRGNYSVVGRGLGAYLVNPTYTYVGNYNGQAPILRNNPTRNNPNLRNEETTEVELGIETIFAKGRLRADFTYYNRKSTDQIVQGNVPTGSGFAVSVANAGLLRNEGIEAHLGASIIKSSNFNWDIDLNWSRNRNVIEHLDLSDGDGSFGFFTLNTWSFAQIRAIPGELYGSIVSIDWQRDDEGRPLVDADSGLPIEDPNSILGNATPDWIGSVRNTIGWKGFNLSFLIDIKAGGDLLSLTHARSSQFGVNAATLEGRDEWILSSRILGENNQERSGDGLGGNPYNRGDRVQGAIYDGVQYTFFDPDGDGVGVYVTDGSANDIYIDPNTKGFLSWRQHWRSTFDASYVKLREVTLGYSFPKKHLSKTPLTDLKISLVGRNLWIIHQNTPRGIDPEGNSTSGNGQGLEFGAFLPTRSVGLNVNVSF